MNRAALGWVRGYRLIFAILTFIAIAYQLWATTSRPTYNPVNFFSFFTIQSNIIAAVVLLWGALRDQSQPTPNRVDLIRGAAVTYMTITGVVYGLLLSDLQEQLQTTVPWVDVVLHRIIPLVMVFDWLVDPPDSSITFRSGLLWLIYPLLYAVYTLIRGPFVNWYPYPFLDPDKVGGYGVVGLYAIGITIGAMVFVSLVVYTGQRFRLDAVPT